MPKKEEKFACVIVILYWTQPRLISFLFPFFNFFFSRLENFSLLDKNFKNLPYTYISAGTVITSIAVALYSIDLWFSDSKKVKERTKVYDVKGKVISTKMYKCHSVPTRLYCMSMSMHRKKRVRLKNEQRYNCRLLNEK